MARAALLRCRVGKRPFFDVHSTEWFAGVIRVDEVSKAKAIDCWGFGHLSVLEVARRHPRFSTLKASAADVRHPLILVSESPTARPHLLDGYHRASGLIHSKEPQRIPAFWAVCPKLRHWGLYWPRL